MRDFSDKVALLTGAASGIGRATAVALAREGAGPLVLTDIDGEGLGKTAALTSDLGAETVTFTLDVSDPEAVIETVEEVVSRFGRVDLLINVAGVRVNAPFEELDIEDWWYVTDVDLDGVFHTCRAVYPHMLGRRSGHIVNVASTGGLFVPGLYMTAYVASKFAVVGLSESLMLEAARYGVGVTCVCPGVVKTPIYEKTRWKGFSPEAKRLARLLSPVAEEPEDTARAILKAVRRGSFLVVTTWQARLLYYLRRHTAFVWFAAMRRFARLYARVFDRYRVHQRSVGRAVRT